MSIEGINIINWSGAGITKINQRPAKSERQKQTYRAVDEISP